MRSLRLASVIAVVFLAAGLAARPAHAGDFGLVVAGEPAKQPVVETTLEPWLTQNGKHVKMHMLDAKQVDKIVDCFILTDQRCAEPLIKDTGLSGFLFVMVEVKHDTKAQTDEVRLSGWLFGADGQSIAAQSVYCHACRNDTLGTTSEDLARTLFSLADAGSGRIKVVSTPPGAKVAVDGAPAGATPLEQGLRSGPHVVELELSDFYPERREVAVAKGEYVEVDVTMRHVGVGGGGGGKKKSPLPYVVMAGGGALVVTGVILFAIDQDCVAGGACDVPNTQKEFRNSAPIGVGLAAAGAVVAGAGVYLMLHQSKKHDTAVATPWVSPTAAGLAYATRF